MGRHTAAPTQPVATQAEPDPAFAPITDPLLLDAVERELGRTRTAPHALQLRAQLAVQPTAEADDDEALDDGSSPPSQPIRVQFGTRVPMRFAEDGGHDEEDGGTRPVASAFASPVPASSTSAPTTFPRPPQGPAWSSVDPLPAPASMLAAGPAPVSAPTPVSATAPVAETQARTETTVPARSMMLAEPESRTKDAAPERQGNPLTFWIVVGVSMIAVLTLVALLPF